MMCDSLVADLAAVAREWRPDRYGAKFAALPRREALRRVLSGAATLSGFEMSSERISVPLATRSQEDEQSCFSDNTVRDLSSNVEGLALVLEGDGESTGLLKLFGTLDPKLAGDLRERLVRCAAHARGARAVRRDHRVRTGRPAPPAARGAGGRVDRALGGTPARRHTRGCHGHRGRRRVSGRGLVCTLLLAASATARLAVTPAGRATVSESGRAAFTQHVAGLDEQQLKTFALGNRSFSTDWIAAPASVEYFDGLGPYFSQRSCSGCHLRDGRGRPRPARRTSRATS
jgi:hypothetical protein